MQKHHIFNAVAPENVMCFYFYMIFSVKPVYCAFISVWGGAVLFLLQSHSIFAGVGVENSSSQLEK